MEISVIICTHNPRADYLKRVLAALRKQTLSLARWELLLIDNASREPVSAQWDLSWHPNGRHVHEAKPGKLAAMLTGFSVSQGGILITVDDDNVLGENYLSNAIAKIREYPTVGIWSGTNIGEYEAEPGPSARAFLPYLAVNEEAADHCSNDLESAPLPIGAGMVVRREVARRFGEYVGEKQKGTAPMLNRAPGRLHAGQEDTELGIIAIKCGFACGRSPAFNLLHLIPRSRLRPAYLARLARSIAFSHSIIYRSHGIRRSHWTIRPQLRPLLVAPARLALAAMRSDWYSVGRLSLVLCTTSGRLQGALIRLK